MLFIVVPVVVFLFAMFIAWWNNFASVELLFEKAGLLEKLVVIPLQVVIGFPVWVFWYLPETLAKVLFHARQDVKGRKHPWNA